jgi:hypothetical protein
MKYRDGHVTDNNEWNNWMPDEKGHSMNDPMTSKANASQTKTKENAVDQSKKRKGGEKNSRKVPPKKHKK